MSMSMKPLVWMVSAAVVAGLGCGDGETVSTSSGGAGGVATTGGVGGSGGSSTTTGGTGAVAGSGGVASGDWQTTWAQAWSSDGIDDAMGKVDAQGNVVLAGAFSGTITFPGQPALTAAVDHDGYVVKLAPDGKVLWVHALAGTEGVDPWSLDTDAQGHVVVAGRFSGSMDAGGATLDSAGLADAFVLQLDEGGALMWAQRFGSATGNEDVSGVGYAPDGQILLAGQFETDIDVGGPTLVSSGSSDLYAARLAATGEHLWSRAFGDSDVQLVFNAAVDPTGDLLISGVYAGTMDFGLGALPPAGPDGLGFVARLDGKTGDAEVSRSVGDALGYVTGAPDGFYFAGTLRGSADFGGGVLETGTVDLPVVARYDAAGAHVWSQVHGDTATLKASIALPAADAGGLVAGWALQGNIDFGDGALVSAGDDDIALAAFAPAAGSAHGQRLGAAGKESPRSIALGPSGQLLVVGVFAATTDLGSGPLTAQPGGDVFVALLAPK